MAQGISMTSDWRENKINNLAQSFIVLTLRMFLKIPTILYENAK